MRISRIGLYFCISSLLWALPLSAQAPETTENLVYSVGAFDGKDYSGTFVREDADAIYLIGNVENFLNVRKTRIYFWPITQEWKADYETLNVNFIDGTIELTDKNNKKQILEPVDYTYYNYPGEYEINWKVFIGEAAQQEYAKYEKAMADYWKAVEAYREAGMKWEMEFNAMIKEITQARERGAKKAVLDVMIDKLTKQQEKGVGDPPARLSYYVRPVDKAYLFKLPPGEYKLRYLTKDGEVMEGSNKRLVVHSKRRENGIGYEIIPADKWTRRQLSQTPSSVLYVNGNTDLYVQPFYQDEFNDLFYQKTIRNDAMGNPDIMTWIKIQQVPKTRIEIIHPKKETESIVEAPYYVEQIKGSALGYKIVPFDPEGKHKDREPSLMAFHIPVSSDARTIELKLQDKDGKALPSGERQIRVISKSGLWYLSLILAFIPIGVMVVVLILRTRRYS